MKHRPVSVRLTLAFIFVLSGLLIMAGVSRWAIETLSGTIGSLYRDNTVAGTELAKASNALLRYRNHIIQIIGVQSKEDLEEMYAELPKLTEEIRQYLKAYQQHEKRTSGTHDETKEFAALETGIEEYFVLEKRTIDRLKSAMEASDQKEKERLRQAAIQNSFYGAGPTMNVAGEAMDRLLDTVVQVAADSKAASEETITQAQQIVIGVLLACLVLGTAIARLLSISITRPLKTLSEAVSQIAKGNLKARATVTARDEVGRLAQAFNEMGEKLELAGAKQEELVSTLNNAQANLVICDRNLSITYVNKGAEATFGNLEAQLRQEIPAFDTKRLVGASIGPLIERAEVLRAAATDSTRLPVRADVQIGSVMLDITLNGLVTHEGEYLGLTMEWVNVSTTREAERTVARMQSALEHAGTSFLIADEQERAIFLNKTARECLQQLAPELQKRLSGFNADGILGESILRYCNDPASIRRTLAGLGSKDVYRGEMVLGPFVLDYQVRVVLNAKGEKLAYVLEWRDVSQERKTQHVIAELVEGASNGSLSTRVELGNLDGVYRSMAQNVNRLLDAISVPMHEVGQVMKALSSCDLTVTMTGHYKGEFEEMKRSLNEGMYNLTQNVVAVREAVESVASGAEGITDGYEDLSRRTSEQAKAVEKTSANIEALTSTVRQNADNAKQANQLAIAAHDIADKGGAVTYRAVEAMGEINKSSKKIADIITVIDEIAFQTNLLALNAAVEAARAGEHGRGFAVVAAEVRNLAQRSATAAKEIKGLINESIQRVTDGSELVHQSGRTLEEIVHSVKKVSDIIAEITSSSQEQAGGIEQTNTVVRQMESSTQQNAALVEQMAGTTRLVKEETKELYRRVLGFTIQHSEEEKAAMPAVCSFRTHVAETIHESYESAEVGANADGARSVSGRSKRRR
jgi:methyl-accepting chemotaxis protein